MTNLDKCKQITDTESGRVLLYRDEVEAVLTAGDTISRAAAIDALGDEPEVWSGKDEYAQGLNNQWHYDRNAIKALPSVQPERLTDDDFEAIRIHLNAYKETLCNQRRWKEAEEYQRIIDRFMSFASAQPEVIAHGEGELTAQPEIIRCKDCKWCEDADGLMCKNTASWVVATDYDFGCVLAERRQDG